MTQKTRCTITNGFKNDIEGHNPCFLISTTGLIGTGTDISRASFVVLFEPCWTSGEELQAYGRINRVSSTGTTKSYRLCIIGHPVEEAIRNRQNARGQVSRDALESLRTAD